MIHIAETCLPSHACATCGEQVYERLRRCWPCAFRDNPWQAGIQNEKGELIVYCEPCDKLQGRVRDKHCGDCGREATVYLKPEHYQQLGFQLYAAQSLDLQSTKERLKRGYRRKRITRERYDAFTKQLNSIHEMNGQWAVRGKTCQVAR